MFSPFGSEKLFFTQIFIVVEIIVWTGEEWTQCVAKWLTDVDILAPGLSWIRINLSGPPPISSQYYIDRQSVCSWTRVQYFNCFLLQFMPDATNCQHNFDRLCQQKQTINFWLSSWMKNWWNWVIVSLETESLGAEWKRNNKFHRKRIWLLTTTTKRSEIIYIPIRWLNASDWLRRLKIFFNLSSSFYEWNIFIRADVYKASLINYW